MDLRERIVRAVEAARGGGAVRGERELRDQADAAVGADGERGAGADGWAHAVQAGGACGSGLRAGRGATRCDDRRAVGGAEGSGDRGRPFGGGALPAGTRADAQKKTLHAAEQARPDVAASRAAWRERQPELNAARLVFVDETWATTNMARRYGRSLRGRRLVAAVPHGHWKTSTFVAGLRCDRLIAPLVIDGAINGETFRAWVEQFLAPTLEPGDLVVMDNLAAHKVAGVREAIEVTGASVVYLPPYSPDLNPIEQLFAKLKALLRKRAARSVDTLWNAIGELLGAFTFTECANYFANLGYLPPDRDAL
jgi:transposase